MAYCVGDVVGSLVSVLSFLFTSSSDGGSGADKKLKV
jgi:hypothetical protein